MRSLLSELQTKSDEFNRAHRELEEMLVTKIGDFSEAVNRVEKLTTELVKLRHKAWAELLRCDTKTAGKWANVMGLG